MKQESFAPAYNKLDRTRSEMVLIVIQFVGILQALSFVALSFGFPSDDQNAQKNTFGSDEDWQGSWGGQGEIYYRYSTDGLTLRLMPYLTGHYYRQWMNNYSPTNRPPWESDPEWKTVKHIWSFQGEEMQDYGIEYIGHYAFYHARQIKDFLVVKDTDFNTYQKNLHYFGDHVFEGCTSLEYVSVPNIENLGSYTFYNCSSLHYISTLPDKDEQYPYWGESGVTEIQPYVFYGCESLKEIRFPNSLKTVGDFAFEGCSSLSKISFGKGIETVSSNQWGSSVFYDLDYNQITDEELQGKVFYGYGGYYIPAQGIEANIAYRYDGDTLYLYTPSNLNDQITPDFDENKRPSWERASEWNDITDVVIRNLYGIGDYAFYSAPSNIKSMSFPNFLKTIGDYALYNCTFFESLTIPDSVIHIGKDAFGQCTNLSNLTLPITLDPTQSFSGCSSIEKVTFTPGIDGIGIDYTYQSHKLTPWYQSRERLTEIEIQDGVKSIGDYTFFDCYSLTSITLPDSVTAIRYSSFSGCTSLTDIEFGIRLNSVNDSFASHKFFANGTELAPTAENLRGYHFVGGTVGKMICTASSFLVTFDSNGGSYVEDQRVDLDGFVVEPENPTRGGYTFVAWYLDGSEYDFDTPVTSNITLVAYWEVTVTFVVNNDGCGSVSSSSVKIIQGSEISIIQNLIRIGDYEITATPSAPFLIFTYSFVMWEGIPADGVLSKNITITAVFSATINTFTVSFKVSEETPWGTVGTDAIYNVPYGTLIEISGNKITIAGKEVYAHALVRDQQYTYSFDRWEISSSTGGYTDDNTTITAVFSATINSTATFDSAGGGSSGGNYAVKTENGDLVMYDDASAPVPQPEQSYSDNTLVMAAGGIVGVIAFAGVVVYYCRKNYIF